MLDDLIGFFSPKAKYNRKLFRSKSVALDSAASMTRKYEAASKSDRLSGWYRPSTGANAEISSALHAVRDSSRDLARNNPWGKRAAQVIAGYTVGRGLEPDFVGLTKRRDQEISSKFKIWATTTECDADGDLNFYGLQRLVMRSLVESGEVIIRRRWRKIIDGLAIPLQLQVLESDYIDTAKSEKIGNNTVKNGIEFDAIGRRVAYWLFDDHPGESSLNWKGYGSSKRVPASEILHIFRKDRCGQIRGMPWGHAVIVKLKDLDDVHDAYLLRQKIAACFTAFIYESTPSNIDPNLQYQNSDGSVSERVQPGLIESLPPGKDIKFASPPGVDGLHEFSNDQLHAIAVGFGISYESLTGDLSNVSFLSGRMGWLDMYRNVEEWQTDIMITQFCQPVMRWAIEAVNATNPDLIPSTMSVEWTAPGRSMLDPEKEFKVLKDKVRNGMPLFDLLKEVGYNNPERALERKAEENKLLDDLKLILDNDPRNVTTAGNQVTMPQNTEQSTEDDENVQT